MDIECFLGLNKVACISLIRLYNLKISLDSCFLVFDSTGVTKPQVRNIEKIIEQYADQIRTHKAELVKLENPIRFAIKSVDKGAPLTTIPTDYNDCFLTLVTRTNPLRKSNLVTEIVQHKLLEDIKTNALDIRFAS